MTKKQIYNITKLSILAVLFMLVFEVLFYFDSVTTAISNIILNANGMVLYIAIYFVMLIQVSVIPLPVYVVINAAVIIESINLNLMYLSGWNFVFVTMFAYMTGVIISYFIGKKWGSRAVKWCAGSEEEYIKWIKIFNNKGKWYYALTVLLPVFPDDLLCLVAGGVKLNFWFYFFVNLVFRFVGLVAMILSLQFVNNINSSSFPFTLLLWSFVLFVLIIVFLIFKLKFKNEIE